MLSMISSSNQCLKISVSLVDFNSPINFANERISSEEADSACEQPESHYHETSVADVK